MRIEKFLNVVPTFQASSSRTEGWKASDSIRYGKNVSSFWNYVAYIRRKISNFFRRILSFFFSSVRPKATVYPNEIDYEIRKIFEVHEPKKSKLSEVDEYSECRILLNEMKTDNHIKYTKEDKFLHIHEFAFPDEEMQEHIRVILEHILEKEKAEGFRTECLKEAKILWDAGFQTASKICFDSESKCLSDKTIISIIETVKQKKDTLNDHYKETLKRIEEKMNPRLIDSILESFYVLGLPKIALADLLILIETMAGKEIDNIRFGNEDSATIVEFKP